MRSAPASAGVRKLSVDQLMDGLAIGGRARGSGPRCHREHRSPGLEDLDRRRAADLRGDEQLDQAQPPMSVWSTPGASQAAQGRWKNVWKLKSCDLIELRICCWTPSRVRSFDAGLHEFSRVRARISACSPLRWWTPGLRLSVKPPWPCRPRSSEQIFPVLMSTPPMSLMNCGKRGEVDDDQMVDLDAGELLDHLQRQRGSALGPGGVDLLVAVARDVDHRVARDR